MALSNSESSMCPGCICAQPASSTARTTAPDNLKYNPIPLKLHKGEMDYALHLGSPRAGKPPDVIESDRVIEPLYDDALYLLGLDPAPYRVEYEFTDEYVPAGCQVGEPGSQVHRVADGSIFHSGHGAHVPCVDHA